jgi:hypothetical protein
MVHTDLEGGCWYLEANDGKHYELFGDSATLTALHRTNAVVDITVEHVKSGASTCMVGEIVRVISVQGARQRPYDPPITPTVIEGTVHRTKAGTWYLKLKEGTRFEFQSPPATKFRHTGVHYHGRVLLDPERNRTKENMDGLIMEAPNSAPKKLPRAKGQK